MARREGEPLQPNYELTPQQKARIGQAWELDTRTRGSLFGPDGEETPGRVFVEGSGNSLKIKIAPDEAAELVNGEVKTFKVWDISKPPEERRPLGEMGVWQLSDAELVEYTEAAHTVPQQTYPRRLRSDFGSLPPHLQQLRAQQLQAKQNIATTMFPSASAVGRFIVDVGVQVAWQAWEGVRDFVKNTMTGSSTPSKGKK